MSEGMMPARQWARTEVHKASTYSCVHCGRGFKNPHKLYEHLDEGCEPIDMEIRVQSRVRIDKAVGTVDRISGETIHVDWDSGAHSPVPVAWLTKEIK